MIEPAEAHSLTVRMTPDRPGVLSGLYPFDYGAGPRVIDVPADGKWHDIDIEVTSRGCTARVDGATVPIRRPS